MSDVRFPHAFLFVLGALVLFGLTMLSTASAALSFAHTGDDYYYLKRQIINGVIPGIILFFLMNRFPYERLKSFALPLFVASLFLLFLVFIPGTGVFENGATRWVALGSFSFQPSEVVKLTLVMYLAALFDSKRNEVGTARFGLIPFLGTTGSIAALLVAQPDLGTLGVISLTAFAVYFIAGARMHHLALALAAGIIGLAAFVSITGYEFDRIKTYLNPHADQFRYAYQVTKARNAIESGGFSGIGFGRSQQKSGTYLPEPMGDSISAIIASELGFIGIMVMLGLFAAFGWFGFLIARSCRDLFGKLLACGIVSWVLIQACINIAAISGLLPLTGIPLPFVSYGGTSLVVLLTACGILYNIQRTTSDI